MRFAEDSKDKLELIRNYFAAAEGVNLEGQAESALQQMRELSICGAV